MIGSVIQWLAQQTWAPPLLPLALSLASVIVALTPIVYTRIADHGVALALRYLCPVRKRRGTAHLINEGILEDFARESGIELAYPTTRFYDAARDGAARRARRGEDPGNDSARQEATP